MSPELRLVKGESMDDAAPTRFAPDRLVPVRIAQLSGLMCALSVLAALFFVPTNELRALCWGGAIVHVCIFLWSASSALGRASVRYQLGSQRLEIERGLIARRRESIDLFRIRDVVLDQGFIQRLRGLGNITLFSTDQVEPTLVMLSLGNAQAIYEQLRDASSRARQQRVVQIDG